MGKAESSQFMAVYGIFNGESVQFSPFHFGLTEITAPVGFPGSDSIHEVFWLFSKTILINFVQQKV